MNRKQKIIVSVTGIFLVLLIIVGLTYAYFLTQIKGNTNNKSISVTTANLILTYADGNGVLETGDKLRPGSSVNFKTSSGTTVNEKTFTVTNSGDNTSYVVIVDNVNVTPEPFESNDFRYTLTCTSSDDNKCDGTTDSIFPLKNQSILLGNKIAAGTTHTYTLTMEYKETGENQSNDMGKTFTARINIEDIRRLDNPYASNTNSLAYNIINNSVNATNRTELLSYPLTKIAEEISTYGTGKFENIVATEDDGFYQWDYLSYGETAEEANSGTYYIEELGLSDNVAICNAVKGQHISDEDNCMDDCVYIGKVEDCTTDGKPIISKEIKEHEKTLSVTQDDYGTSYYFRGNVEDNYVNFAGMCWRIVRIAGDGSTKLLLEDQYTECDDTINNNKGDEKVYTGNWNIGTGNYGYDSSSKSTSGSTLYKMNYLNPVTNNTSSMVKAFYDFQTTKLADYTGKLKSGDWCLGDKAYTRSGSSGSYTLLEDTSSNYLSKTSFYYDAYTRLTSGNANGYQPTLKCNGTILNEFADVSGVSSKAPMYVSAITADEIAYAGGKDGEGNINYYLINNYQKSNNSYFWSLSPDSFSGTRDHAFCVVGDGRLFYSGVNGLSAFRPSVSLASSAVISSGEGTLKKPYVIG